MAKSKADFLKFAQREYVEVDGVRLQSLTELEMCELRARWAKFYEANKDVNGIEFDGMVRRGVLVASIVDEDGNRIFSDDDVGVIATWRAGIPEKLHRAARQISNLDEADTVEDEAGKSGPATDSD